MGSSTSNQQNWKVINNITKNRGYVTGTLDWTRDLFTSTHDYWQQKKGYYGGLDVTELAGGTTRIAPYFAPGGGYVLMVESVEGLTSPFGRSEVKGRKQELIKKDVKPFIATTLSIAPEVLGFGLGFISSPLLQSTKGYFSSFGRTEIPLKDLVPADVIAGRKFSNSTTKNSFTRNFEEN